MTGKELLEKGEWKPGKWMREALEYINNNELTEEQLQVYVASLQPTPHIQPFETHTPYFKNIESETADEEYNMQQVFATMEVLMKVPTTITGAVMPDACPTGTLGQIPVGGVVVTKNAIHPSFHSADICCSVMMTKFKGEVPPKLILDTAQSITHFGSGGRRDNRFTLPKELEEKILNNIYLKDEKSLHLAKTHLGTQGDGNHFLFVGRCKSDGATTMVTHHGSRGFGAHLFKKGVKIAEKFRKAISPKTDKLNAWIPYDTQEGKDYWEALQIVREWTKLNHQVLHDAVSNLPVESFWNEHNFVFKEGGNFYHAKGATPLLDKFVPDNKTGLRLIPLNMSQPILVVRGEETENNLGFAPHGAGRNISRTKHKKNVLVEGRTIEEVFAAETKGLDIRFSGKIDISELPSAYKNTEEVKQQMKKFNLGIVVDEIMPYGCIMAGDVEPAWRRKR